MVHRDRVHNHRAGSGCARTLQSSLVLVSVWALAAALLTVLPANAGTRARALRVVTASAPRIAVESGVAHASFSIRASRRVTIDVVRLRLRPVGKRAGARDSATRRHVTVSGKRSWTLQRPGLTGTWKASVAWRRGGGWSKGPSTIFTVGEPTSVSRRPSRPKPTPTPSPSPSPSPSASPRPSPSPSPSPSPTVDPMPSPTASPTSPDPVLPGRLFGTLQSSAANIATTAAAGVSLATLDVAWNRFEPVEGQVDVDYASALRSKADAFRAAGQRVVLNTGVHHPPAWVFSYPHSRYVDQFGDVYAPTESGKKIANMVFNQQLRDKQSSYLGRLFALLGTDFYGVRLGGGWYGELNYPEHDYRGRSNAYWGFDANAVGAADDLPGSLSPNPVPDWLPGTPSPDHTSARRFSEWYLGSLQDYHDWQIRTVRALYPGRLLMLYPSWGIRPGQLDAAVAADLSGTTSAERNGEVQRGFDFARFVRGVSDPGVVVYTTWLNADASADAGSDKRYWSPVHWLSTLARERARPLAVMGENTGRDSVADLALTMQQARTFGLETVVWAFEPELYAGVYASIEDLAAAIARDSAG